MALLSEKEVFAKTVYAEARGESEERQRWIAWVIKNRARMNREYWGGSSIKNVCLCAGQFKCWNGRNDIEIDEPQVYKNIRQLTDQIYDSPHHNDPTGGADHYNNPECTPVTFLGYPAFPIVLETTDSVNVGKKDMARFNTKDIVATHVFYTGSKMTDKINAEKEDVARSSEKEVFAKTIYAEARGEPKEGQIWVAWVIKNRSRMNREYWGGSSIKNVCLCAGQFECWNGKNDITINEPQVYDNIRQLTDQIYDSSHHDDPTGRADHYNNLEKEGYPSWTEHCTRIRKIGHLVFYYGPKMTNWVNARKENMPNLSEKEVFAKTVYAEARGEPEEGQIWVAWVIKNRAEVSCVGSSIKDVCLCQFECWNGRNDIEINEPQVYDNIRELNNQIYNSHKDPTGGADHYNNPEKEGYPSWTKDCTPIRKIGRHVFYKGS